MTDYSFKFFKGADQMSGLMRHLDWSQTSLGAPQYWPDSLKSAVIISLNSMFPIAIYWGKDFSLLYNDAWSSIPGEKHPWSLGRPGALVWPEIWEGLRDEFESVLNTGESIRRPDALLPMRRFGYTEECYFDYTLSPIANIEGEIGGVLNAVIETTYRVINDRRSKVLNLFVQNSHQPRNEHDAVTQLMQIIESAKADIPFALLYTAKNENYSDLRLAGQFGLGDSPGMPDWNYGAVREGRSLHIDSINEYLKEPVFNVWPDPVREALIVPIRKDEAKIKGFMVLGASSGKKIDGPYQDFLEAVGMHAGTLLNNGYAFEISEAFEREQALNEELASANEELSATNEELQNTQESLNRLNNELEIKVEHRTAEVTAAQYRTEKERDRLRRFLMEAPAGICVLHGEDLVFELANPIYQQLLPGRALLGKPILSALPEIKEQPIWGILQRVYATGETFEGNELYIPLARHPGGPVEDRYFNFTYQARFNDSGQVDGILVFCFEVTDTVKSKLQIKEKEANLRGLVMTAHYPLMVLKGSDFVVEIANEPIALLWDKKLAEITGRRLLDILPELEGQPFPQLLKQVYETGISYGQEEELFYVRTDDGSTAKKYISFYYDALIDSGGLITGIVVAANDITAIVEARKELEASNEEQQALNEEVSATNEELAAANEELITTNEELYQTQQNLERSIADLAESESLFRTLIDEAPVPIAVFSGRELIVESANRKVLEAWGKSDSIIGQPLAVGVPELNGQDFLPILDNVYTTGKAFYGNEVKALLEQNGVIEEVYSNFVYQPLEGAGGLTSRIMLVATVVTEQVIARKKLEEAARQLRFILNAIPQQVWTAEPNGQLNYVNQVIADDFGFGPEEVVGWGWKKFIHPEDLPLCLERWGIALKTGAQYLTEFRLLMKNGQYRWHLARALPYYEDGKLTLWLGTNTDIELQKNNEQKKDEFLSIASHELKTPLTSIKAFNQIMKRTRDAEKLFSFVEKSGEHIFRLEKLINDLLDVTKINAGKLTYHMQEFSFRRMIVNSVDGVQHMSPSHEIVLQNAPEILYVGDEYRLEQVMHNFLTNAVKYSPNGKKVIVNCDIIEESIIVSVQDFGIGIAKEHLDKLFDRYYRVDNTSMRFEGLGLGLFISSEILSRHKGSFWIESEQGKGSRFYFKLPLDSELDDKYQPYAGLMETE